MNRSKQARRESKRAALEAWRQRLEAHARLGSDGKYRCRRHHKIVYRTREEAHAARIATIRAGGSDPGLEIYGCDPTRGHHIGHPGGWKSLQRRMEMAGRAP